MVKIKYKIYPLPNGRWRAMWDLTREQRHAENDLILRGIYRPESAKIWLWQNRSEEKPKLERLCKSYAQALCEEVEKEQEAQRLQDEAPVIEHGCTQR